MSNTAQLLTALYEGDPKETDEYVRGTMTDFVKALKEAMAKPEMQDQLMKEAMEEGNSLLAAFFYMLKPSYVKDVNALVGMLPQLMDIISKKMEK